jgi:hypothetical protein
VAGDILIWRDDQASVTIATAAEIYLQEKQADGHSLGALAHRCSNFTAHPPVDNPLGSELGVQTYFIIIALTLLDQCVLRYCWLHTWLLPSGQYRLGSRVSCRSQSSSVASQRDFDASFVTVVDWRKKAAVA